MKSIIYIAFVLITALGVSAQDNTQQDIAVSSKALATKIGQKLNIDENKTVFLYKTLYSIEKSRSKAQHQSVNNTEGMEEANNKLDQRLYKLLSTEFSKDEIAQIKQIVAKEE